MGDEKKDSRTSTDQGGFVTKSLSLCSYIIFIPLEACLLILALSCGLSVPLQELHTPRFMLFPPHPEVSKPFCLNMLICSVREEAVSPSLLGLRLTQLFKEA